MCLLTVNTEKNEYQLTMPTSKQVILDGLKVIHGIEGQQYRYALADSGKLVRLTVRDKGDSTFDTIGFEIAKI